LIYFPQPRSFGGAATRMELRTPEATLVLTARTKPGDDAVVYFGGNAEDVSASLPELAEAFPDHALYLLHYRGYGGSTGKPSEGALHADALAVFDRVHAEHARVTVVGRSLGTGVAIRLAALRPVARLVLVSPYYSIEELAMRQFPFLPVRWLLRDKFESWRHAPQVRAPTAIVVAERDEIIPVASSARLLSRFAAGVARWQVIPGVGHNSISASPAYLPALRGGP
jgi:pimeloyl-ACP methyl ester carboxylesterase